MRLSGVMKTATNSNPKTCQDCKGKMSKPKYWKRQYDAKWREVKYAGLEDGTWYIDCPCGNVLIWSYPNVWKKSHVLEIGRTMEVVA